MENVVIKGEIFVIPNKIARCDANEFLVEGLNKRNEFLGLPKAEVGEKLVQIWITSEDSDNWSCHGKEIPGLNYSENENEKWFQTLWPGYLKKEILIGLKEGDKLNLEIKNGIVVELTANQKGYRYGNFGAFEEILEKM